MSAPYARSLIYGCYPGHSLAMWTHFRTEAGALLNKYGYTISAVTFNSVGESPTSNEVRAIRHQTSRKGLLSSCVGKHCGETRSVCRPGPPPIGVVPPGRVQKIRFLRAA